MNQIGQTLPGGRPSHARNDAVPLPGPDKWAVLADLVEAAPKLGLRPATLAVLRALLTFLPARALPAERAVVFPSNRTLSARLEGMPESTLRRHLARLVEAGLIVRRDSANRKRFARRSGGGIAAAYGFDLAPVRGWAVRLRELARLARAEADRCALLRDEIRQLRDRLAGERDGAGAAEALEEAARVLRRRPDEAALTRFRGRLLTLVRDAESAPMSGSDGRNGRHQQRPEPNRYGSVDQRPGRSSSLESPPLHILASRAPALEQFLPGAFRNWRSAHAAARRMAEMTGVDDALWHSALDRLGPHGLATAMACILQRGERVQKPGGYLRGLVRAAERGRLDLWRLLVGPSRTSEIVS